MAFVVEPRGSPDIDAFAKRIIGWRVSRSAHAGFVLDALEQVTLPLECPRFEVESVTRGRTMKRPRFTQEQIVDVLKEHQAGATAPDLCRKHGVSEATSYAWRSKYGGMEVSDVRKLKGLEEVSRKRFASRRLRVSAGTPG